jgi:hypothetical protein
MPQLSQSMTLKVTNDMSLRTIYLIIYNIQYYLSLREHRQIYGCPRNDTYNSKTH